MWGCAVAADYAHNWERWDTQDTGATLAPVRRWSRRNPATWRGKRFTSEISPYRSPVKTLPSDATRSPQEWKSCSYSEEMADSL